MNQLSVPLRLAKNTRQNFGTVDTRLKLYQVIKDLYSIEIRRMFGRGWISYCYWGRLGRHNSLWSGEQERIGFKKILLLRKKNKRIKLYGTEIKKEWKGKLFRSLFLAFFDYDAFLRLW